MTAPGTLLFHRDFRGYSGGHGKVWDYFNHALAAGWDARVYLTPQSLRDASNPWLRVPERIVARYEPQTAAALFVGGMDWTALAGHDDPAQPVFNLVQHVRHADPQHPLQAFLPRRAIRICVSPPVADAIAGSGRVNGPIHVIEAALDIPTPPDVDAPRHGIFIDGCKQSPLAQQLAAALRAEGRELRLVDTPIPRAQYLAAMAGAHIAVTLPHATEGFYLPGLEAMALGCATVVPDCIGNRAYLRPDDNALAPELRCDALLQAIHRLDDATLRARLIASGSATAARFTQARERAAFHALLAHASGA